MMPPIRSTTLPRHLLIPPPARYHYHLPRYLSTSTTIIGQGLGRARLGRERAQGNDASSSPDVLTTISAGYDAAIACHDTLVGTGGWTLCGYKVGATSDVVQKRLAMNTPFWGRLYYQSTEKRLNPNQRTHRFSLTHDLIRGVEAEFAFVLKKEIPASSTAKSYTPLQLMTEYVSQIMPAIEICASRTPLNAKPTAQALIADSGGNGSVILGWESVLEVDTNVNNAQTLLDTLEISTATVMVDGNTVASGAGRNVLGNPANALAWFVNLVTGPAHNISLYPNQIIITGATCGLIPITKSSYVRVQFPDWRGGWKSDLSFRDI